MLYRRVAGREAAGTWPCLTPTGQPIDPAFAACGMGSRLGVTMHIAGAGQDKPIHYPERCVPTLQPQYVYPGWVYAKVNSMIA